MSITEKDFDERGQNCACRGGFGLRKLVRSLLESPDFEDALKTTDIAPKKMINPLLCFLFETDEVIRWRAVRGVGITVSAIAEKALEPARTIMRRLIWSLNDQSGGIGWGAPEALGEIMAENETLAREYYRILVSYIDENGNLLENNELERGVMWGIHRLAQKRPELLREWTGPVLAQLKSPDPVRRGLALRTLLFMAVQPPLKSAPDPDPGAAANMAGDPAAIAPLLVPLLEDQSEIRIFQDGSFAEHKIGHLASELLDRLKAIPR
ncbi:MAG: DVU0298 family protein [Syntrophobacteraceae bacterium]